MKKTILLIGLLTFLTNTSNCGIKPGTSQKVFDCRAKKAFTIYLRNIENIEEEREESSHKIRLMSEQEKTKKLIQIKLAKEELAKTFTNNNHPMQVNAEYTFVAKHIRNIQKHIKHVDGIETKYETKILLLLIRSKTASFKFNLQKKQSKEKLVNALREIHGIEPYKPNKIIKYPSKKAFATYLESLEKIEKNHKVNSKHYKKAKEQAIQNLITTLKDLL